MNPVTEAEVDGLPWWVWALIVGGTVFLVFLAIAIKGYPEDGSF